jgi:hypothetical protein
MCSNILYGTVWTGPARGRKKGSRSGRKPGPKGKVISQSLILEEQEEEEVKPQLTTNLPEEEEETTFLPNTFKQLSQFKRTVYFVSNCGSKEKTYLYHLNIGTYYHCSACHDYHKIREIR